MPKDKIFIDKPPINPIKTHLKLNSTIEKMKQEIRGAITIEHAVEILMQKFGQDYLLFILQAVRERFQTRKGDIERYL